MARLLFHVGGPAFHPVAEQAQVVRSWLAGTGHEATLIEGNAALELLPAYDLLVLMGLFHTGQDGPVPYVSPTPAQRQAFAAFVRRRGPILAHHGGIASYDDWEAFRHLLGFAWIWGRSNHSRFGEHTVRVVDAEHPVTGGVGDFVVEDEIYYDLWFDPGVRVHAVAPWDGRDHPMVCTLQGRADGPGGRVVYLANGHDLRAFAARPAAGPPGETQDLPLRRLWLQAIAWLTGP